MKKYIIGLFACSMLLGNINAQVSTQDNQLSAKEKAQGWQLLFDGKSLEGWHGYRKSKAEGWVVKDGELTCLQEGKLQRGDLVTNQIFSDFELVFDWKIAPGHNSGLIYRCTEDNGASYESGPEYQLIDDVGYPEKLSPGQYSGANYDMDPPVGGKLVRADTYNHSKIVISNNKVEHWLNGVKVAAYEFHSPSWNEHKAKSKWSGLKTYGASAEGYIALQDHGGGVTFKNVKIKRL